LVRAVFLDLGETLVHLDRPWEQVFQTNLEALCGYLESLGLRLDFQKFTETFVRMFNDASYRADVYKVEIPMQEILSKVLRKSGLQILGIDLPTNAMIEFYRPEVESWQLYPDAIDTLTKLDQEGYSMGVISNAKSDWMVRAIVVRRDIGKFLNAIVSSAAMKIRKPRAEIFIQALNELNAKPRDSIFVGDSISADVAGAKSLGMRAIHVLRKPIESDCSTVPDATVTSLSQAREIIDKWNNAPGRN
jgi:HAD superfamily hydrolase (TIGR01662 family)